MPTLRKPIPVVVPPSPTPEFNLAPIERMGYTPEEAALALGIGRTQLFQLIKDRKLQVVRNGKSVTIPSFELRAYQERNLSYGPSSADDN